MQPEIIDVLRKTWAYLSRKYADVPTGQVTRLAECAPIKHGAAVIDAAALAGDLPATKQACRAWIAAWRELLTEPR